MQAIPPTPLPIRRFTNANKAWRLGENVLVHYHDEPSVRYFNRCLASHFRLSSSFKGIVVCHPSWTYRYFLKFNGF